MARILTDLEVGDIVEDKGWIGIVLKKDGDCITAYLGYHTDCGHNEEEGLFWTERELNDGENSMFKGSVVGNIRPLLKTFVGRLKT